MATNVTCPNCKQSVSPEALACPNCGAQMYAQPQSQDQPQVAPPHSYEQSHMLTPGELRRPLPDIVKQFDTSATTNMTIAGVLVGFYSGAIFAGKVLSGVVVNALLYALPICFLLITIIFALRVFYPDGYLTDDYLTLIQKKERRLYFSSIFLEIAIGILIIAVFVYLLRPA